VWAVHCRYGWLITREIAERFHVSQSSVIRAIRRRRRAGSNDATQAQGHVAEDGPYRRRGLRVQDVRPAAAAPVRRARAPGGHLAGRGDHRLPVPGLHAPARGVGQRARAAPGELTQGQGDSTATGGFPPCGAAGAAGSRIVAGQPIAFRRRRRRGALRDQKPAAAGAPDSVRAAGVTSRRDDHEHSEHVHASPEVRTMGTAAGGRSPHDVPAPARQAGHGGGRGGGVPPGGSPRSARALTLTCLSCSAAS
jgi:hypothetical protein